MAFAHFTRPFGSGHLSRSSRACITAITTVFIGMVTGPAGAVGPGNALNDTGVATYGNSSSNNLASEPADHPGQDARYGRDAAATAGKLPKTGAGSKGFDFTKISNSGSELAASAALGTGPSDWACTRDNVTGLTWEVKVDDAGQLRHHGWTYSWYDTNNSTNGGASGTVSGGSCGTAGRCDTAKFVQDVNAAALCGRTDWRMPTRRELASIVDYGRLAPAIDASWFPNTMASEFWSASTLASLASSAWVVVFSDGYAGDGNKGVGYRVRLVRAGP